MEHPLITTNPGIEGGKPIIKGTRITVEMLAEEYAAGRSIVKLCNNNTDLQVGCSDSERQIPNANTRRAVNHTRI